MKRLVGVEEGMAASLRQVCATDWEKKTKGSINAIKK
jgi:hypothetical protein